MCYNSFCSVLFKNYFLFSNFAFSIYLLNLCLIFCFLFCILRPCQSNVFVPFLKKSEYRYFYFCLLSLLAGVPPFLIFFIKFMYLFALLDVGRAFFALFYTFFNVFVFQFLFSHFRFYIYSFSFSKRSVFLAPLRQRFCFFVFLIFLFFNFFGYTFVYLFF